MYIILHRHFDEGNRADMKSGDTNKMIHILFKENVYLCQKHCLTMTLYLEQYANVIFLYNFAFILQLKVLLKKKIIVRDRPKTLSLSA